LVPGRFGTVIERVTTETSGVKACRDIGVAAAIALQLAQTSIRKVEDVWSLEKIYMDISSEPRVINAQVLEEIVFRSFDAYLKRPGHVLLPNQMIPTAVFEKERRNPLLRVRMLWEYWHGSPTLDLRSSRRVSTVQNRCPHKKNANSRFRPTPRSTLILKSWRAQTPTTRRFLPP
jgi:hypothetical protein